MKWLPMPAMLAVAFLAACASSPRLSDAEERALYRAHAGEPVSSFSLFGKPHGWTALGDDALVVWTRPRQAWLLDLSGSCQDLPYALSIMITSTGSRVQSKFDSVQPVGPMVSPVGRMPCRIHEIRPLDTTALRQAEQELRQAEVEERPGTPQD